MDSHDHTLNQVSPHLESDTPFKSDRSTFADRLLDPLICNIEDDLYPQQSWPSIFTLPKISDPHTLSECAAQNDPVSRLP